jgi:hypothetical protein
MKFTTPLSGLLFIFLSSCDNPSGNNSQKNVSDAVDTNKTTAASTPNDSTTQATTKAEHNYFFEPETSVLTGTLTTELYYGPPNFGESPETDAKEYPYIFYPDHTINVIQTSDSSEFDVTTQGITKIQLAPVGGLSLHSLVNKKIQVTGQFYGAHTGHHHTDVLMTVEKAEEL